MSTGPADPDRPQPAPWPADPDRTEPATGPDSGSASAERTRLSWRRTTLAATAAALLAVRLAARGDGQPLAVLAIAVTMLGWLAQLWLTHRRIQAMAHREPATAGRTLPATALLVAGLAVVGVVLTVAYAPR